LTRGATVAAFARDGAREVIVRTPSRSGPVLHSASAFFSDLLHLPPVSDQTLNGHLCRLVGELVRQGISLSQASREFERQFVLAALREHAGSVSRSAHALGVHRNTLRNKMAALHIEPQDIVQTRPRRRASAR
jgi:DNA-binding NtrC family response regulator